ncbi:MAG: hypothetical protein JWP81_4061 [Ferruginibacter sp.]|nr:hypothetical protein [Ferruginibacter sp.]
MLRRHLIKDKEKRKRVAHIAAAVTILIHSYDNYETRHHSYKLFAVAGIIVLTLALFHSIIEKQLPWVDGAFFVIEAVLSLVVAFDLFNFGKKALPITYLLLGLFQFYLAFRKGKKGIKTHKINHQKAPKKLT